MPVAPYSPVPEQGLIHGGPSGLRVTADPNAFGENVGRALGNLGKVVQGAGEEMFNRALAFQQLRNETEAKEADTDYVLKVAERHAQFQSLQGKAAVDAYPAYSKGLQQLRTQIRDKMSNDASRRMFDSQSLGTMSRTVFSGASHSATQNKRWAVGTSEAKVAALGDQALSQPSDEAGFVQSIEAVRREVAEQGDLSGWGTEQTAQATAIRVSELWSKRIEGLAKTQPLTASKMLDKAVAEGNVRGEQIARVTGIVQRQLQTVGARQISARINSGGDLKWGAAVVPISEARDAVGEFESGGEYSRLGVEVFSKGGVSRGRALGKYQVMPENLPTWLAEAGLPSMTPKEFLANPKAQDQVFDTVFGRYMHETGSFNEAVSMWFSGTTIEKAKGRSDALGTTVPQYIAATNTILARNKSLGEKVERARSEANAEAPNDPTFADFVVQRVTTDYDKVLKVKRDDAWNNKQTVEEALLGGTTGKIPTTVEEIFANGAQAEKAWNDLDPSVRRSYMKVLAQNAKGDVAWDNNRLREYQRLQGMAASSPAEFLDTNVVDSDLPWSAKRELVKLQQKVQTRSEGDPRTTAAMRALLPMLGPAELATRTAANKDRYDQFVGALQDSMKDFTEQNKRPPKLEDIQLMGARLLQEQVKHWFWANERMFEVKIPSEEMEKVRADLSSKYPGVNVSDEQIQRAYIRQQYQKLYGKSTTPTEAVKPKPQNVKGKPFFNVQVPRE